VELSANSRIEMIESRRVCDPFSAEFSAMGRAILLWLLGVPIPIIILLALFWR
jgi:hypothetical protein